MSFGRVSFARLSVAGAAVLAFMFGVWGVAQMIGGPIDRPLPLGPAILDRNAMPLAWLVSGGFYAIVMAPVMEELCFRGWMLRGLRHRFSPATAILIPAFLFASLRRPRRAGSKQSSAPILPVSLGSARRYASFAPMSSSLS